MATDAITAAINELEAERDGLAAKYEAEEVRITDTIAALKRYQGPGAVSSNGRGKHFRKGTGVDQKLPCPKCGKTFMNTAGLGAHQRVHGKK